MRLPEGFEIRPLDDNSGTRVRRYQLLLDGVPVEDDPSTTWLRKQATVYEQTYRRSPDEGSRSHHRRPADP